MKRIIIKVESTFGHRPGFRLTAPTGEREHITGDNWTRKLASEGLDLYENVYGYQRSAIRFDVH